MTKVLSGIYEISFLGSSKKYIGSSIYLDKRINDHLYALKGNYHVNKDLQQIFNTCGTENTSIKILEYIDNSNFITGLVTKKDFQNELFALEQSYLDKYYAQEYIKDSSDVRFFKLLYNKSVMARYALTELNTQKEVHKYDLEGNYLESYYNSNIAELCTGIDSSSIRRTCQNIRKSAGNFRWSYCIEKLPDYKKKQEKIILQYKGLELINSFKSIAEASRVTGIDIRKGESNHFTSQGGYYWVFEDEKIEDYMKQRKRITNKAKQELL